MQRNPTAARQVVIGRHMNAATYELMSVQASKHATYLSCASPARSARTGEVSAQHIGVTFVHRRPDVIELGNECMLEPIHKRFREKNCKKWLAIKTSNPVRSGRKLDGSTDLHKIWSKGRYSL